MTAVAEGLPRGPSQIKSLFSVVIAILSVEGMAGEARDPSLIVKNHIGRDFQGRDQVHGMRPHGIAAMMPWMARVAHLADIFMESQLAAGKGKVSVTFDARDLLQTVMRVGRALRGGCGEQNGQYESGRYHRLNAPICSSMALTSAAMFRLMAADSAGPGDVFNVSTALASSSV